MTTRRAVLRANVAAVALAATLALTGCAPLAPGAAGNGHLPIVFVHGNGDSAALWLTTDEVTPGVKWFTLRSDNHDKFAQPDGVWIGFKGVPTNVIADSPAHKGAIQVVLPQRDHREVSFHAQAFAKTFEFVAGRPPARLDN